MRRRATFIPSGEVDYDPSELKIQDQHISFAGLKAAREERLTFSLKDLPVELLEVLERSHELHIRWAANSIYDRSYPYLSSTSPGLHVFYTPQADRTNPSLCDVLHQLFSKDLRCSSPEISFSRPDILSERFASAAALQYYAPLSSLQHLVRWLQTNVCSPTDVVCRHDAALLSLVDYLDIDYDSIGHALIVTAYWSKPPAVMIDPIGEWTTYDHWNLAVDAAPADRIELGILKAYPGEEPAEIQLEGFLVVAGEDEQPKPTVFFTPSRHHTARYQDRAQTYSMTFDQPTGLHPQLRISFPSPLHEPQDKADDATCALHAYFTLPSAIFADEYAFPTTDDDPLFQEAHNIARLRSLSGERDLEIPDYVVRKWGSAMLLELATPSNSKEWDVTVPLHLRYLEPIDGGQQEIEVPWPVVFWACTTDEGTKFNTNPFDRVNLGYDGLFGPRVMFYHLEPRPQGNATLMERISVPVLDTAKMSFETAEILTLLLVTGGFLWIAAKVIGQIVGDFTRPKEKLKAESKKSK